MDEQHSTHEMVRNLHNRFDTLDEKLDQLADDHKELKIRVDGVERDVLKDAANLERHESEACLREKALVASHGLLRSAFDKHAEEQEQFRQKLFWLLISVILMLLAGFGSTLLTLFVKFGGMG